ncbi:MAG TPA: rubrerythrin family protein [Ruminococcaceae bacterium]|nr:rubrerythrin family protein [Oscillospiraceae bacterium]
MATIGNPYIANLPKQMSNDELAQAVRLDMIAEMETVVDYEAHAMATADARVKKVMLHIAEEERQHMGELEQVLYMLSPKDEAQTQKGIQKIQQQKQQNFAPPLQ